MRTITKVPMRVITKIPLDYKVDNDEPLFEFEPIKRVRTITNYANNSNYSFIFFKRFKNYNPSNELSLDNRKNIVIKNIGNLNAKHLKNVLDYVLRNSEDKIAINEYFEFKTYKEILENWQENFSMKESAKEAMHLVFSLKETHSQSIMEILKHSVYETMRANLSEYSFVLIPHSHQSNPHIHCIINKTNTWTGKKLHFAKKSDCRDFFFKLKEDFKNEVYYLSGGKLDYKNDVKLKFNNLFKELQTLNEESKSFNHQGFYSQSIKDLNKQHLKIKNNISSLELKIMRLYQHKDSSKNNQDKFQNDNLFSELSSEDRAKEMKILQSKIAIHNKKLKEIEEIMKKLLDWDSNFNNFTKSFNLFEKKKILYDSIIKMKPYVSKTLFKNLHLLENQLNQEKNYIQDGLEEIDRGFDKNVFLNEKSNMFALNKKYQQLKNYTRMLKEFQTQDSGFNPKEAFN
ncbi:relaxase/mobilization nuclease domain-containing protein, partial [Helicobacter sp. 11S03491-1]|uniref:relaxase/mobilization nuclease domain-containing protein n=1 Tax=Helicobacter sp. 11S03491-1 TaxID=1476196 RepID=UPI000BA7289B